MKKLILMRHAEAALSPEKSDFERCLTDNGIKQSKDAAEFIKNIVIDKLLVSSATRTTQTSEIILSKNSINDVETLDLLYKADFEEILSIIKTQDNSCDSLMIISHNPTIHELVINITQSDDAYEHIKIASMKPAQIYVINLNFDAWSKTALNQGYIDSVFITEKS